MELLDYGFDVASPSSSVGSESSLNLLVVGPLSYMQKWEMQHEPERLDMAADTLLTVLQWASPKWVIPELMRLYQKNSRPFATFNDGFRFVC